MTPLLKLVAGAVPAILIAILLLANRKPVDRRDESIQQSNDSFPIVEVDEAKPKLSEVERPAKWIHKYIDEQRPEFEVKILDESFDQRMANSIRLSYLTKVAYFFSYKFHDSANEQLAAGTTRVNDLKCKEHLSELTKQMEEMGEILTQMRNESEPVQRSLGEKHLRLAKVLDSFGRYEAGFLLGRTHSLGSYTQCRGSQLLLRGQLVGSRYCMANLDLSQLQHPSLRSSGTIGPFEDLISVAICLPESCHTKNFKQNEKLLRKLVNSQFELPESVYRNKHLPLASVFCEIDQDSPLVQIPFSGRLLIAFLLVWTGLTLYATCTNHRSRLAQCFNLRNSWEDFIGFGGRDKRVNDVSFDTLNPIKVLGCVYVVLGHAVIVHLVVVMDGIRSAKEFEDDPWMFLVAGLSVIVDSFYVITGMIIAYIVMKRTSNRAKIEAHRCILPTNFCKQCLSFISMRYLRLVPLYFLVFWFKKSLMPILSSGPLWDYGYNRETEAGSCREESWLTPFTFQAAYLPLARQCMCQAWSIAGDLFFSVAVAPIVILMTRRPKLAALISVVLGIASNVSLTLGVLGIDANIIDEMMEARGIALAQFIKSHSYIYTAPHYRIFSVLVGVLAGYVLHHHYGRNRSSVAKSRDRWPRWFAGPATKAAFCFSILDLGLPVLAPYTRDSLLGHSSLAPYGLFIYVETTGRLLWAISSAIIFLRMVTDWKNNFWMRNSAGQFWSSVTKLNYAILLVHMDLLKFDGYMQLNTSFFSRYAILKLFAATYLFCIPLALVLHLLFEHPINKLVKLFTNQ